MMCARLLPDIYTGSAICEDSKEVEPTSDRDLKAEEARRPGPARRAECAGQPPQVSQHREVERGTED